MREQEWLKASCRTTVFRRLCGFAQIVSHAFSPLGDWHAEGKESTQREGASRWSLSRRRQAAKARGGDDLAALVLPLTRVQNPGKGCLTRKNAGRKPHQIEQPTVFRTPYSVHKGEGSRPLRSAAKRSPGAQAWAYRESSRQLCRWAPSRKGGKDYRCGGPRGMGRRLALRGSFVGEDGTK